MKHIFIINPRAGRKNGAAHLMDQIEALRRVHNLTCETVLTGRQGHAEEVARRAAESGEAVRLYACGGDGTLNEVLNGAAGADRAEVLFGRLRVDGRVVERSVGGSAVGAAAPAKEGAGREKGDGK